MLSGFLFFACVTVSLKFLVLLFKNLLLFPLKLRENRDRKHLGERVAGEQYSLLGTLEELGEGRKERGVKGGRTSSHTQE